MLLLGEELGQCFRRIGFHVEEQEEQRTVAARATRPRGPFLPLWPLQSWEPWLCRSGVNFDSSLLPCPSRRAPLLGGAGNGLLSERPEKASGSPPTERGKEMRIWASNKRSLQSGKGWGCPAAECGLRALQQPLCPRPVPPPPQPASACAAVGLPEGEGGDAGGSGQGQGLAPPLRLLPVRQGSAPGLGPRGSPGVTAGKERTLRL